MKTKRISEKENDLELAINTNTPIEVLSELAKDEVFNENKNKNI